MTRTCARPEPLGAKFTQTMSFPPAVRQPGQLYPPLEPYNSGWLRVSSLHEVYYEESGKEDGNPVLYL